MHVSHALERVGDPHSPASALVGAAANAALTLIDPRRLSAMGRVGYRAAVACAVAWSTWAELRGGEDPERGIGPDLPLDPIATGALVAGAGRIAIGVAEVGEALDARVHDALARRGVARPRVWMALGAGVLSLAAWRLGRRPRGGHEWLDPSEHVTHGPMPPAAAAVARRLVEATDDWGAPALRTQLAEASSVSFDFVDEGMQRHSIEFRVPEELPLAVPGEASFPVTGRFTEAGGREYEARLQVSDGQLGYLELMERFGNESEPVGWYASDHLPAVTWPEPGDLALWIETPEGPVPLGEV